MNIREEAKDYTVERLIFFSDAVFAIAITLLALELKLPTSVDLKNDTSVLNAIHGDGNQFLAFIISFIVIASFWSWHVHAFKKITHYKAPFVWLNSLMLFLIVSMPFTTSLISGPSGRVTGVIYAANIALIGLVAAGMLQYAHTHRFIQDTRTPAELRKGVISMLAVAGVFVISIPIILINPEVASFFWLVLIPVRRFIK